MQDERVKGHEGTGQMGVGHVVKGGDNTTAWEKLLPTFDFSFRADRADSKPSSAVQSPPIRARSFFSFFPFHPNLSAATSSSSPPPPRLALTQAISRRRHLDTATTAPTPWPLQPPPRHPLWGAKYPLHLPSHTSWAHTSHPATVALTVPSAP